MKLAYVAQPFDKFFPPDQNSIGLIVHHTALELARSAAITLYGKHYRNEVVPDGLPFELRRVGTRRDQLVQRFIRRYPRLARDLRLDGKADEHAEYQRKIRRALAADRPDIVHVMNYWPWCRDMKAPGSGRRLVLEMQCEWLSERDRQRVAHQLEAVDAVVAVSDHIANTFRNAFPDYPGLVATVGNGVDVGRFTPRREESDGRARKDMRNILFVGRLSPEKGIHTLIEAFGEVRGKVDDVELHLAGPYWALSPDFITSLSSDSKVAALLRFYDSAGACTYRQHLDELVERLGLRDRVRFLGNVPHADLVATYRNADVVVNPSLSESFGISVVEAMACAIPVVGTRIGGMCESILHGTTGLLVEEDAPHELAEALIAILDDRDGARAMGREGRKRAVEHYSWEARAKRLMSVYRTLTTGGETRAAARREACHASQA